MEGAQGTVWIKRLPSFNGDTSGFNRGPAVREHGESPLFDWGASEAALAMDLVPLRSGCRM